MGPVQGRFGLLLLGLVAMACDDTQATCRQVVVKYQECEDKIIEDKIAALPELFRTEALDAAKQSIRDENAAAVEGMRQQCESGKFTPTERKLFAYWRQCVKKPCAEYLACITGAADAGP